MPKQYQQYESYSVTQFVLDDDFIEWIKTSGRANSQLWQDVIAAYPLQAENMEQAKKLVLSLDTTPEKASPEVKDRVWKAVQSHSGSGRLVKMSNTKTWIAAASVFVVLLAAGWYLGTRKNGKEELASANKVQLKNDAAPGGNKAILTLGDGSTIILDSAAVGTLASQGTTRIIKLDDGRLAYQPAQEGAGAVQFNTIATPRGGQYQLVLADGSRVWLNAASSISYPTAFSGNERRVSITGEAYFEVAHDPAKPFHVQVKTASGQDMDVKVLGTHFNINAYDDEEQIRTTLLEGSVEVSNRVQKLKIIPGQQAIAAPSGDALTTGSPDLDQVMAWKNGFFQFNNASIQEIMRQLSRWYDVEVVYQGKIPSGHYVGRPSRNLNLSKIVKVIEYSGVKVEVKGNKIIVIE